MSGCNENRLDPDGRRFDLVKPLADHIDVPPDIFDSALHRCAERTVIIKTCGSAVEFKRVPEKPSSFCQSDYLFVCVHSDSRFAVVNTITFIIFYLCLKDGDWYEKIYLEQY